MVGFPIRTSPDQCLVDGSPELFAVTHVLHRFLAPRHSPLALISLEKTNNLFIYETTIKRQSSRRCSCLLCSSQGATRHRNQHPSNAIGKDDDEAGSTVRHERVRLPQNRREDNVHLNPLHQEGPNPYNQCALSRQTCQCTNRCVMQPQRTNVSDRLMKHSLERR